MADVGVTLTLVLVFASALGVLLFFIVMQLPKRAKKSKKKSPKMSDAPMPTIVKFGDRFGRVPIEVTTVKPAEDGKERRVVIGLGKVSKKKPLIIIRGLHPMGWQAHFLNLEAMWKDGKVHFDRDLCEPLNEEGKPVESIGLKKLLVDSGASQLADALTLIGGLNIPRQVVVFGIVIGVVSALMMLSLDSIFTLIPNEQIHWLPAVPKFGR